MVFMGRASQWSRGDIRALPPDVFGDYLQAAVDIEKTMQGAGR